MSSDFLSIEGGEGCGKTTQIIHLVRAFEEAGHSILRTREPGGDDGSEMIRSLLVEGEADRWEPMAETLLFLAARQQHVERVILPSLRSGAWVVSDRFHDSTRVYQGIGKSIADDTYMRLHEEVLGDFVPSLTLLLDIDPEVGVKRSLGRENTETRFEGMDMAFHTAVREGFLDIARREPERMQVIDASASVQEVHDAIIEVINATFGLSLTPIDL